MSTTPDLTVRDPFTNTEHKEPTHEKARAVGHQLAWRILPYLRETNAVFSSVFPLGVRARTIDVRLAGFLGLIDRGHVRWRTLRTEVALLTLGDASFACVPGEINPELVNGGIEKPSGADFENTLLEEPPLRQLMPGRVKFVFGLANDEIGYIIPRSQWDEKPPFTYGAAKAPYGEINSVGPEAAPAIYQALLELCRSNSRVHSAH
jgi:hypothetical protein